MNGLVLFVPQECAVPLIVGAALTATVGTDTIVGRGLGETALRRGDRDAAARPAEAPRASAEVRGQELAVE